MNAIDTPKPITIAIIAMGGEGGGVLADWIADLAEHNGYLAQTTSVPGVAQRTGSTIYYVELFPESAATSQGRQPVLALMPVPGEVDIVIASELMEAGRAVQRGFVSKARTSFIFSTHRVYSMPERTAAGDGRVDDSALLEACRTSAKNVVHADFASVAETNGSVISAALFGGIAASRALPFDRSAFEESIRRGGVGVDRSLAAFTAGLEASVTQPASQAAPVSFLPPSFAERIFEFPVPVRETVAAGVSRLVDYQDAAYAARYLDRLTPIRMADSLRAEVLRETARYLALWMSYEDAIRVADLKIRRERFERVKKEARLEPTQLLHIKEFLHPGVQEIADILPLSLGKFLLNTAWARGLVAKLAGQGRIIETSHLGGFLQLYAIASLRPLRPRSHRFQHEQTQINTWLGEISALMKEDYELAMQYAECPRLLKGYGETYERGRKNFEIIVGALPQLRGRADAAAKFESLTKAALADDSGAALSDVMKQVLK